MVKESASVFIVSSPRHFVLSCVIAESAKKFNYPILVIADDFSGSPLFYEVMQSLVAKGSPFKKVYILKKKYAILAEKNLLMRLWLKRTREYRQLKCYRFLSKKHNVVHILTSEVNSVFTQYFMNLVSKLNKVSCHYIEDGLFSYVDRPIKKVSFLSKLIIRLKYGFNYQSPAQVGSPPWVTYAWLLNPKMAIKTIQQKKVCKVERDWFNSQFMRKVAQKMLEGFELVPDKIRELDILIVLDVRRDMKKHNPNYDQELSKFIASCLMSNKNIGIKLHPRDVQSLADLNLSSEVINVSKSFPAELLLPFLSDNVFLVGDFSTVFIDLKAMRPAINMQVVQTNKEDQSFNQFFLKNSVRVVENYQKIDGVFG